MREDSPSPSSPATITNRFVKNLVAATVTSVVILFLAEVTTRLVYHPENLDTIIRYDPTLGWSLIPNARCRSVDYQRHLDYIIRVNSLGMRERHITLGKPPGKRRVLLIGDSVTFGTGVDDGWRFSDFMQRALEGDVEVINAGVPGWGPDQELVYFESFARRLDPDIVVVTFTMTNDVVNNTLSHLFLGSAPKPRFVFEADSLRLVEAPPVSPAAGRPLWKRALRQSRFLLFVKRRIDRWVYAHGGRQIHHLDSQTGSEIAVGSINDAGPAVAVSPGFGRGGGDDLTHWSVFERPPCPEIEEAWRVTEAVLSRFARRCRESNAVLIVFALPPRIEVDRRWRWRLMTSAGLDSTDLDFIRPFDRLSACCRHNGVEFVHPVKIFAEGTAFRDLYHAKDSHPNRYGHALAARVLLETLRARYHLEFELAEGDRRYVDPP